MSTRKEDEKSRRFAIQPWIDIRFQLVSWWDMKERAARSLIAAEDTLTQCFMSSMNSNMSSLGMWLEVFEGQMESLGMKMTLILIKRIKGRMKSTPNPDAWVMEELEKLKERWNDELKGAAFLQLEGSDADDYQKASEGFGEAVNRAFPSSSYDAGESIRCLALGRYTAAVLHAMRCLEFPLGALCKALKVKFPPENWNQAIELCQKNWKDFESKTPTKKKPKGWKKLKQFYSEAFLELLYVKDAWRNHAMHAHTIYVEDDARKIVTHTRNFLSHLATKLHE